ncbi:hypothetical protein D3C79_686380 [compost metagenome]
MNWVQRSSRIRSNALSTSHLYISNKRLPLRSPSKNCACRPLTWNSGTAIRLVGARPLAITAWIRSGELTAQNADWNSSAASAWQMARWLDSTPLARLVVPEV